jgi:L-asparagine transporter-like permease
MYLGITRTFQPNRHRLRLLQLCSRKRAPVRTFMKPLSQSTHIPKEVAASFMNTVGSSGLPCSHFNRYIQVILTSVLSAGNHALFAGTRVLYSLAVTEPRQAPRLFAWTTPRGIPLPALLATSSVSALCFGSSFIGSGQMWSWLQNLVGVSNQVGNPHLFQVCA